MEVTVSNLLRNTSEQSARAAALEPGRVRRHGAYPPRAGASTARPDTTWRWASTCRINAKTTKPTPTTAGICYSLSSPRPWWFSGPARPWTPYAAGLLAAVLLFCFYLKWQPYLARLELPLSFWRAVAAYFLTRLRPALLAVLICAFPGEQRAPLAIRNWTRPSKVEQPVGHQSGKQLFLRHGAWNKGVSYFPGRRADGALWLRTVGIDISQNPLEYLFQALLRERNPAVALHTHGRGERLAALRSKNPPRPCAVLCLDCAGIEKKVALYAPIGPPIEIGRFLLFLGTNDLTSGISCRIINRAVAPVGQVPDGLDGDRFTDNLELEYVILRAAGRGSGCAASEYTVPCANPRHHHWTSEDTSHAVVPSASVTVTNTGTDAVRTVQTNTDGIFVFPSLVPGFTA